MATIKAAILGHNECGAGEGGQEAGVTTLDFYPTITPPPPPGIELSTNLCRCFTITERTQLDLDFGAKIVINGQL